MSVVEDDGEILKEDLASPDFILRNLKIAFDVTDDPTQTIEARRELNEILYNQTIYYLYAALTCYEVIKESPTILIYGAGYTGNNIISRLMSLGLTYFLRVFSRGDEGSNYWKSRGLQASSNLSKLIKTKADIVIITSPLSSFPAISKHLSSVIDNKSFVISCAFGLQRKRIYCNLNFPSVMRTFTEAEHVTRRLKAVYKKRALEELEREKAEELAAAEGIRAQVEEITPPEPPYESSESNNNEPTPQSSKPTTPALLPLQAGNSGSSSKPDTPAGNTEGSQAAVDGDDYEDLVEEEDDDNNNEEDEEVDMNNLLDDLKLASLSPIDYAADLVAIRVNDIRLLLYVFENFYALNGMSHPQARFEALKAGIGYEDTEYYAYDFEKQTELELVLTRHAEAKRISDYSPPNVAEIDVDPAILKLRHVIYKLKTDVVNGFHRHISKYIRVVDLPKITHIIKKIETLKEKNPEIVGHMHQSIIDKYFPKENDDETVNSDMKQLLPEVKPTVGVDLAYQPMHSHEVMTKLYDQDRKFKAAKTVNTTTIAMMDDGDGESVQSDVSLIIDEELEIN